MTFDEPGDYARLAESLRRMTRGHQHWLRLTGECAPGGRNHYVYVIEVEPITDRGQFDFYVGYTGNAVRTRFEQHVSRGDMAARIFRYGYARPVRVCDELMLGAPPFPDADTAKLAEGLLARRIRACGYRVKSDALRRTSTHGTEKG